MQEYLIAVQVPFQTCLKLNVCLVINKILPFHNSPQLLLSIAMNIIYNITAQFSLSYSCNTMMCMNIMKLRLVFYNC